jgi:hypothetical protein
MPDSHKILVRRVMTYMLSTITALVGTVSFLYSQDRAEMKSHISKEEVKNKECEEDRKELHEKIVELEIDVARQEGVMQGIETRVKARITQGIKDLHNQ